MLTGVLCQLDWFVTLYFSTVRPTSLYTEQLVGRIGEVLMSIGGTRPPSLCSKYSGCSPSQGSLVAKAHPRFNAPQVSSTSDSASQPPGVISKVVLADIVLINSIVQDERMDPEVRDQMVKTFGHI